MRRWSERGVYDGIRQDKAAGRDAEAAVREDGDEADGVQTDAEGYWREKF